MYKLTVAVVVPNWNGAQDIGACLDSLQAQSMPALIIVVDNASSDSSAELIEKNYPAVHLIKHSKNLGFAGGVNAGIKLALDRGQEFVALLNNDAVADENWLKQLHSCLSANPGVGIATCKLLTSDKTHLDNSGECFTNWGLAYPRGRGEIDSGQYDESTDVFGASGGASLYRVSMLRQIGLFDESFFAYYEDVDLSFRAQLAGWKIAYVPQSKAYHQIGATSRKLKGFTTYQTLKNLPMVVRKNVPLRLLPSVWPRFWLAYTAFFWSAVARGQGWWALKGWCRALLSLPKNFGQRWTIQKHKKVSTDYIRSLMTYDLPPAAARLRRLRAIWRR